MKGHVLLVEDEELVGAMVKLNLESTGYEVTWATDGRQGREATTTNTYDLILLDISMPDIDGLTLLRTWRHTDENTPVMMLTARSDVPTKVRALELGADDYLSKPFDVSEMIARVGALLRRSQRHRFTH